MSKKKWEPVKGEIVMVSDCGKDWECDTYVRHSDRVDYPIVCENDLWPMIMSVEEYNGKIRNQKPQDKDLCWCWNDGNNKELGFYDAINGGLFKHIHRRGGHGRTNYKVIPKEVWQDESKPEWQPMRDAYEKLED